LQAARAAGFLREVDIYDSRDQIENDPHVKDFLRPRGLGWAAGTLVSVPNGDNIIFSIEREYAKGPVEDAAVGRLDLVRPHLARAALLSARLGFERARALAQAMQAVGLPAAVLRHGGCLSATNLLFEKLIPAVIEDRRNRVVLVNRDSDRLLESALANLNHGVKQAGVLSIAVPAASGHSPMALHLVPVCGIAHDIFSQAASILIATPVDRNISPNAELLEGLFDLTPTEARIARAIAQARSIEAIARLNDVSIGTVRNQLKSIFAKTGTGRQVELVRLLSGLTIRGSSEC
jgi:DNA-binding CsgD family transcriptional regulator